MKARLAPIHLISTTVIQSELATIGKFSPKNKIEYDIDFDVKFLVHKEDNKLTRVNITTQIDSKGDHGYYLKTEMFCDFGIIDENDSVDNITLFALAVSEVRAYLRNLTTFGVHGIYNLPLIHPTKFMNAIVENNSKVER